MDETLKRLLDSEHKAEQMVQAAKAKREEITRAALDDARRTEQQFNARIPELHDSFLIKAQERATQNVAELQRRSDERSRELHQLAEEHEAEAVEAALALIVDPDSG